VKKVFLLGGAGYIGTTLVPLLLKNNYIVTVLDNFLYGKPKLAESNRINLQWIEGDMRDIPVSLLQGYDIVINLGGISNDPTANFNPELNWDLNMEAAVQLAIKSKQAGVAKYILASSCSIYDNSGQVICNEDSLVYPKGAYASSKYAAEKNILDLRDHRFETIILRKGTIFGFSPRIRLDLVVNTMVKDAILHEKLFLHGGGQVWRPLIEVNDIARAYIKAIETDIPLSIVPIFNLSFGNHQISEIGHIIQECLHESGMPCELVIEQENPTGRNYRVSNEKAKQWLHFEAQISIKDSVKKMISILSQEPMVDDLENPRYYNIRWIEQKSSKVEVMDNEIRQYAKKG
jgi:nucleoside-diphosphate-sugar epimerase